METPMKTTRILSLATVLALACGAAGAHTGHGTNGLAEGLIHPFGIDHLLAMLAVGVWSAAALPHGRRWWGPAVFMTMLAVSAAAAAAGLALPLVESAIALSVAVFGAMLMAPRALPASAGLVAVGLAAALHGLAHGAELPAGAAFASYAGGFLLSTALLHGVGLAIGQRLLGWRAVAWQALGAAVGVAGLALLAAA
jgi:urease accessory protein